MRYVAFALLSVLSLCLNCGFFGVITIAGARIDFIVLFVVSLSFCERSVAGLFIGALTGLAMDVLFSQALGMYALPYLVAAALSLFIANVTHINDKIFIPAITAFAAFIAKDALAMLLAYVFGGNVSFGYVLVRYSLLGAGMTAVLTPLFYFFTRKLFGLKLLKAVREVDISDF